MEKAKLVGVQKRSNHAAYKIKKEQHVFHLVRGLLSLAKIKTYGLRPAPVGVFGRPTNPETGQPDFQREELIEEWTDLAFHFLGPSSTIEVIFGSGHVFILVAAEQAVQKEISEWLAERVEGS